MSNTPLNTPAAVQSTSNSSTGSRPPGLPKTIEEATRRYLANYQANFVGPASEMSRLRDIAEAKIYNLRKKQPKFFEEKLPTLVNQACSELLTCNTSNAEGNRKFHHTHKHFLRVLDEFWRSVPEGEVNFQTERERSVLRDKLCHRQLELRAKIDQLESNEIDLDELGDEDDDTLYAKTYSETDRLKAELHTVSVQIAALENETLEEEIKFELNIQPRSILRRLNQQQIEKLENMMLEFVKEHKAQKTAMYVDISIIDDMIARLDIDSNLFTKEEVRDMSRDALDAYRRYYRERESERRNDLFESLLRNRSLLPKEGLIFEGPDDVAEEVLVELDQIDRRYKRKIEDYCDEMAKRPCQEEIPADDVEEDAPAQDTQEILASVRRSNPIFAQVRVKEEPRDDYEYEVPSEDEFEVEEEIAEALAHEDVIECADENNLFSERDSSQVTDDKGRVKNPSANHNGNYDHSGTPSDAEENASPSNDTNGHDQDNAQSSSGRQQQANRGAGENTHESDISDLDPDIEVLGIVEPNDKIKHVDLG